MVSLCICISYRAMEVDFFQTIPFTTDGYFTTDVYNALQIIIVFLTDVPKLTDTIGPVSVSR